MEIGPIAVMPSPLRSTLLIALTMPLMAQSETVFDTGEDIYAEDGPWMAIPPGFDPAPPTAADIIVMADLDGDPLVITAKEREMIALLTMVLLPQTAPVSP